MTEYDINDVRMVGDDLYTSKNMLIGGVKSYSIKGGHAFAIVDSSPSTLYGGAKKKSKRARGGVLPLSAIESEVAAYLTFNQEIDNELI